MQRPKLSTSTKWGNMSYEAKYSIKKDVSYETKYSVRTLRHIHYAE